MAPKTHFKKLKENKYFSHKMLELIKLFPTKTQRELWRTVNLGIFLKKSAQFYMLLMLENDIISPYILCKEC
jgi:hypothetical protein